jgi:plasmid stabilization system protein ParE
VKVQWTERAFLDLEDLLEFIAVDNPGAASRLHDKVIRKTDALGKFIDLGPMSKEPGEPFREILVKPLRILYLHEEATATIAAVFREEANLRQG